MTLNKAVCEFLDWKQTHMDNTHTYRTALRPILSLYGPLETNEITIKEVTEIASNLGNNFMFLTVLKIFARYCHYAKIEFVSPHLIMVGRKRDPVNQAYLDKDQIDDMCSVLEDDTFLGIRNQLLIKFLFDTGCRISEVLDLTLSQIDTKINQIKIVTKKSHINRYIMWTKDTHKLLQTYLGMRVSMDTNNDYLFVNQRGNRLTNRGVEYMFSKVSMEALGEHHHPHETRHGKAHSVIEKGGEAFAVKTVLGHTNLESALTYLRLHAKESLAIARKYL